MIDFLSNWAEQLVIAMIIATIIEMILPNNKNKKYIKMVIGIFILFNIVSPFVNNKEVFSLENFNAETYTASAKQTEVNQETMDKRLQELYIQELEKNVQQKIENEGFEVQKCKVDAILNENEENAGISNIEVKLTGKKNETTDNQIELVNKIEIHIGDNKNLKENEISKQEIESLKKLLSKEYEMDFNKININT